MRILGFIETSLIDWEKKVASVIFVGGCNFNCPFCHNYTLVKDSKKLKEVDWEYIEKKLLAKKAWIDGVVVSGGEPMMHPEIFGLLIKIKELGFKTKIDTNGYFPYPLKEAIELGLVDSAAMDIKAVMDKRYYKAIGREVYFIVLQRTIRLLKESGIDYEFRTTLVPGLVKPEDLIEIAKQIAPASRYVVQQFVPKNSRLARYRSMKAYNKEDIEGFLPSIRNHVKNVTLRGF
jgi:pyruvate formate lyase activating enzyme